MDVPTCSMCSSPHLSVITVMSIINIDYHLYLVCDSVIFWSIICLALCNRIQCTYMYEANLKPNLFSAQRVG